jgi:hypothetical protein
MKKPMFTDRTKLYIGALNWYESGTLTLAPCIDNTDNHIGLERTPWLFVSDKNEPICHYSCHIDPIGGPLTLSKLADAIRLTKVEGYTHLVVAGRTFIWAKHTPNGLIAANGRVFRADKHYCNELLEWFVDWREALPVLVRRLNKRLQEVRAYGKAKRLEYTNFIDAQTAIDKAQATEIRINNKRFKGIPY